MNTLSTMYTSGGEGEVKVVVFPFGDELEQGITLTTVGVTATVASGEDQSPQLLLVGLPQIVGTNVLQRVQARGASCYKLVAKASDSTGLKHIMSALLPCAEA